MIFGTVTSIFKRRHFFLELNNIFWLDQSGSQAHISLDQFDKLFGCLFCRHKNPSVLEYFQNGRILRPFSRLSRLISSQYGKLPQIFSLSRLCFCRNIHRDVPWIASVTAMADRNEAAIPAFSINKPSVMKNPTKPNRPYSKPRNTWAAAAGPWWR